MQDIQLMHFTSHIAGGVADVRILPSRVQWTIRGRQQVVDVIPIRAIASVATRKVLPNRSMLTICSTASAVEFRVQRAVAERVKTMLTQLVAEQPAPTLCHSPSLQRGSIADELMSLRWLRDVGVLTPTEFDEQSAQLLGCVDTDSRSDRQRNGRHGG